MVSLIIRVIDLLNASDIILHLLTGQIVKNGAPLMQHVKLTPSSLKVTQTVYGKGNVLAAHEVLLVKTEYRMCMQQAG